MTLVALIALLAGVRWFLLVGAGIILGAVLVPLVWRETVVEDSTLCIGEHR